MTIISALAKRFHGEFTKFKTDLSMPVYGSWVSPSAKILIDCGGKLLLKRHVRIWEHSKILILKNGTLAIDADSHIERCGELVVAKGASLQIGCNTGIGSFCNIRSDKSIVIGSNTLIAQFVTIVDGQYVFDKKSDTISKERYKTRAVSIGNNAWIGAGAIILPGVTIGDGAVIGAGSVVPREVSSHAIAYGNPARVKGYRK